jgi:murein DD-endopeptidase MepM/ murein hydrolase activator NlpD
VRQFVVVRQSRLLIIYRGYNKLSGTMFPRKVTASRWRRGVLAVVVMSLATTGSIRLFLNEPGETALENDSVRQDLQLAGRLDAFLPDEPEAVAPAPEPIMISVDLARSASISSYLQELGIDREEARKWSTVIANATGVSNFRSGHSLTIYRDPATGDLRGLKYNIDDSIAVRGINYGEGVFRASPEPIRYIFRPVAVSFRLRSTFWREAQRNALPAMVVATLDYAFKNRHPLERLPRGADIKLIYQERVSRDGSTRSATGLEAAQIRIGDQTVTALAFRDENGRPRLYDTNGHALGTEALRYPLNFEYISSGFTPYRYHPILHRYRPHEGVDLVARYGTPVRAVADGRVETAGWCGELGHCVRLQHDGGVITIYGHLSQISPDLREGTYVRVGQMIGRVGSSGLSTGPHLHYGLEKDGTYVNPLTATIGANHQVSPRMRALFEKLKAEYLAIFNRLPVVSMPRPVSSILPSLFSTSTAGVVTIGNRGSERSPKPLYPRVVRTTAKADQVNARRSIMR